MKSEYEADELLPLSGIQHFSFCRRQWALIHVEKQWAENVLTVEGKIMHERVEDPYFTETRFGVIIARAVPVASYRLGISGICDVVEFTSSDGEGVHLPGKNGRFTPSPVEYKRGKEKRDPCDEAQLCAQAICIEEMLSVSIPAGFLFYGQTRHRVKVDLDQVLRDYVTKAIAEMHQYYDRGYTPRVKPSKACQSCSLKDVCLPELLAEQIVASEYIHRHISEE